MAASARASQAPKISRGKWSRTLHRRPTRWDVLFHKLAEALARRYWYTLGHLGDSVLRVDAEELEDMAIHMGRAVQILVSQNAVAKVAGQTAKANFWNLPEQGEALVSEATTVVMDTLINYLEVASSCLIKRRHPGLAMLRDRFAQTLRDFFNTQCGKDGDLFPCIEKPLGDHEGYFPENNRPADPADSSGNPGLDAYRLNILVHEGDDAATIKAKLIGFVTTWPQLAPEYAVYVVGSLSRAVAEAAVEQRKIDQQKMLIQLRDEFLFRPCRLGKSPVAIFRQQQLLASPGQLQRLERWESQVVFGLFKVVASQPTRLVLEDLINGCQAEVDPRSLDSKAFVPGELLRTRLLPWDQQWLFSGIQEVTHLGEGQKAQCPHPLDIRRTVDEQDPRLLAARRLVGVISEQFRRQFGSDVALFDSLDDCRAKLADFHYFLQMTLRLPDGRQFIQAWQEEVQLPFPVLFADEFAADIADTSHPAVLYDAQQGMAFIGNYAPLQEALSSSGEVEKHAATIQQLLTDSSTRAWVIQRMVEQHPQRMRELLQEVCGQSSFDLEKDWPGLMNRLRPGALSLPVRPAVFLSR